MILCNPPMNSMIPVILSILSRAPMIIHDPYDAFKGSYDPSDLCDPFHPFENSYDPLDPFCGL